MSTNEASLPYHEPDAVTILIYSSFLLLLNAVNYALDKLVYCGLIGQIFLGVAWGVPGAKWLPIDAQNTIVSLGYIGLILLVFEGGLATNLKTLRANLSLSVVVAIPILGITPVQAFAAGAALCSTSLGTTFTVLSTSGLTESRLGVVLTSAAMLDDVVGLVMVQVISSLGSPSFSASTIIRPVGVSIAFAAIIPLVCLYIIDPLAKRFLCQDKSPLHDFIRTHQAAFIMQSLVLLGFIAGSTYAGTSNLFASYLAGATITWFDDLELSDRRKKRTVGSSSASLKAQGAVAGPAATESTEANSFTRRGVQNAAEASVDNGPARREVEKKESSCTGEQIFHSYYSPPLSTSLKPLFFASIGFSIPITRMFSAQVVWRGFVYAFLMIFGKLLCGACLIRFSLPSLGIMATWQKISTTLRGLVSKKKPTTAESATQPAETQISQNSLPRPLSLYPAAILGSAMVSRGEIGFLISAVAEANGIFTSDSGGDALFWSSQGGNIFATFHL